MSVYAVLAMAFYVLAFLFEVMHGLIVAPIFES
jgi:hypothetical protein